MNLEYFASERFNIAFTSGYHEDDTELPGSLLLSELASGVPRTASTTPDDFADTKDYYAQLVPEIYFTETSYVKVETSVRRRESDAFSSFISGSFEAETEIDTVAVSPQIVINEKFFGRDSKLIIGFDYRESEQDIENESLFLGALTTASFDLSKEDMGVYANAEIPVTEKLSVSGGFRHDQAEYDFFSAGGSDSKTLDENVYNGGLTYQFSDKGSVYFSYAKSYRYPVLDELFNFFTNTVDTTLRQQTTDNFELGMRAQFGPGINVGLNLFRLDTEDEIFFNPVSSANENLDGDTIRQGVELKVSKSFANISLNGSYTFRDTEIDGGTFDGNEIPNVPRHQFTVGTEATVFEKILFNMNGSYIGKRPFISDFANTVEDQDSYFYLTAKLSYLFEKGSAYVTVNNLLDEEYSQFGGLNFFGAPGIQPAQGVNVLIGVTFDI